MIALATIVLIATAIWFVVAEYKQNKEWKEHCARNDEERQRYTNMMYEGLKSKPNEEVRS